MLVPWGTVKSLILFFGPMLFPKALAYYRSIHAAPSNTGRPIRSVPAPVSRALALLFSVAVIALISTLPIFSPENIFSLTQARLQIPVDVLFTRLSALRFQGLTERDNLLRQKLVSLESRLLYFQFGPDVVANCPFCTSDDPRSYLYYALPSILAPYLFNLCVLALVTSRLFIGAEGALWRSRTTIGAVVLAAVELVAVSSYNYQANAKPTRLQDLDAFFWRVKIYRGVGIAALDGLLGWVLYLSSTNRAFIVPPSAQERIEAALRMLDTTRSKMNAAGIVRNTIIRDESLRQKSEEYWVHEGKIMREAMEDKEVLEGVKNALESRINIEGIAADAEAYAGNIIGVVQPALPE
ncbi:MAG: hypothetical protein M1818_005399 [Claussenomyces sp. TS43310]|nr:MAG: hypothetical protein M1818_005399 [Claussenomyces sp. TS43310]